MKEKYFYKQSLKQLEEESKERNMKEWFCKRCGTEKNMEIKCIKEAKEYDEKLIQEGKQIVLKELDEQINACIE